MSNAKSFATALNFIRESYLDCLMLVNREDKYSNVILSNFADTCKNMVRSKEDPESVIMFIETIRNFVRRVLCSESNENREYNKLMLEGIEKELSACKGQFIYRTF